MARITAGRPPAAGSSIVTKGIATSEPKMPAAPMASG